MIISDHSGWDYQSHQSRGETDESPPGMMRTISMGRVDLAKDFRPRKAGRLKEEEDMR